MSRVIEGNIEGKLVLNWEHSLDYCIEDADGGLVIASTSEFLSDFEDKRVRIEISVVPDEGLE